MKEGPLFAFAARREANRDHAALSGVEGCAAIAAVGIERTGARPFDVDVVDHDRGFAFVGNGYTAVRSCCQPSSWENSAGMERRSALASTRGR